MQKCEKLSPQSWVAVGKSASITNKLWRCCNTMSHSEKQLVLSKSTTAGRRIHWRLDKLVQREKKHLSTYMSSNLNLRAPKQRARVFLATFDYSISFTVLNHQARLFTLFGSPPLIFWRLPLKSALNLSGGAA